MPRISQIMIYPVKSLRGISVSQANLTPTGLEHDRRWMLVDECGQFITQRTHPALARVSTELNEYSLVLRSGGARLNLPLWNNGPRMTCQVWRDTVRAVAVSPLADDWLRRELGILCHLVWLPQDEIRPVDPDYGQSGDHTSFADAFPVLLANEASLEDLNHRLDEPVPMNRFRPNLVMAGATAFEEDGYATFAVGDCTLQRVKNCVRCVVTTTDQETGERRGPEPLRELSHYRNLGKGAVFGQNCVPRQVGRIRVGDEIRLLEA